MPTFAVNKEGKFNYTILETLEAGLVLKGYEVKAVKNGNIQLKGSYVTLRGNEFFLIKCYIGRYKPAGRLKDYDPEKPRKILLQKREVRYLQGKLKEKGLTIIPLQVYSKRGILKVEVGIARGKKKHDKRDIIKRRDVSRIMNREIKNQY